MQSIKEFGADTLREYATTVELGVPHKYLIFENGNMIRNYEDDIVRLIKLGKSVLDVYNELKDVLSYNEIKMLYYDKMSHEKDSLPDFFESLKKLDTEVHENIFISDEESFNSDYSLWKNEYKLLLERDIMRYKKLKSNLEELSKFKSPYVSPLNYTYVSLECLVSYKEMMVDSVARYPRPENGIDIFNNCKVTVDVPYVCYKNSSQTLYKIYGTNAYDIKDELSEGVVSADNILSTLYPEDQMTETNTFYIIVWNDKDSLYSRANIDSYSFCKLNLVRRTLTISIKLRNNKSESDIIRRVVTLFTGDNPYENLQIESIDKSNFESDFIIYTQGYDELSLFYTFKTNPLFNVYFQIDESDKPFSLKKRFKMLYGVSQKLIKAWVSLNRVGVTSSENVEVLNEDKVDIMTVQPGIIYTKVSISKAESINTVNEIYYLLTRLLSYYNTIKDDVIAILRKSLNQEELDDYFKSDTDKYKPSSKKKSTSAVKTLAEIDPDLVPGTYSRNVCQCKRQPQIIADSEVEEWESQLILVHNIEVHRQIMRFPPRNPIYNVICPNVDYPYPGVKPNPFGGKYDYLPCCFEEDQMSETSNSHYNTAFRGLPPKEKGEKKEGILAFNKSIPNGRLGEVSKSIVSILNNFIFDATFYRLGVDQGPNSLIHCIRTALYLTENPLDDYIYKNPEIRETGIETLKQDLLTKVHLSVGRQELFDYSDDSIRASILNAETFFDSFLYYRFLEEYFQVNIFVFSSVTENLEIPRHKIFSCRSERSRPSVILYKYLDKLRTVGYPKYDLIISKTSDDTIYTYEDISYSLLEFSESIKETVTWDAEVSKLPVARRNIYSRIDLYSLLTESLSGSLTVKYQLIDTYGKCRGLIVDVKTQYGSELSNENMTIITLPFQPENLPQFPVDMPFPRSSIGLAFALFGNSPSRKVIKDGKITGLWYSVLDIVEGIYIPTHPEEDILNSVKVSSNSAFDINGKSVVKRIRGLNKTRDIILQLCQYLYLLYRISMKGAGNIDSFSRDYFLVTTTSIKDSAEIYDFSRLSRILPGILPINEVIPYFQKVIPSFCYNGKILLYSPKLLEGVVYYLRSYENFYKGTKLNIPKELKGIFTHESDFKYRYNTFVFTNKDDLKIWVYQKTRQGLRVGEIVTKILFEYSSYKDPYLYRDQRDAIFMIQNISDLKFDRAINVAYIWYTTQKNKGYDIEVFPSDKIYPRYAIYELGSNGDLVATEDHTGGEANYLRLLKYSNDSYAAILPML